MPEPAPATGTLDWSLAEAPARRRSGRRWREQVNARTVALAAMVGLILTLVVTAVCGASTLLLVPGSIRPEPSWLAGPLSGLGTDLGLGGLIAVFTVMCASYWLVVIVRGAQLRRRTVVAAVLIAHLLIAAGPLLLSTDVFSYGAYGRMGAVYGLNPYLMGPGTIRFDSWYPLVGYRWVSTPSVYGPLFTALSYAMAPLSIGAAALVYKALAILSSIGLALAGARLADRLGRDPVRALAVVGLNPVLLLYAVGGAHNDMLMLVAIVCGGLAFVDGRRSLSGGLMVVGAAIKLTGGIVLPFALLRSLRDRPPERRRLILGAAGVAVVIAGLSLVMFGTAPVRLLRTLELVQAHGGAQSIPGRIGLLLGAGPPRAVVADLIDALAAVSIIGLLFAVYRQRMDWLNGVGWAFVVLIVTGSYLLPWYVVWLLPFAAVSRSRTLLATALALTAIGLTSL